MTKIRAAIEALSDSARQTLAGTSSVRQGGRVFGTVAALAELRDAGMVGVGDGLTRRGSLAVSILLADALEASGL